MFVNFAMFPSSFLGFVRPKSGVTTPIDIPISSDPLTTTYSPSPPPEERKITPANLLVSAANGYQNDRFRLLHDPSAPLPNIDIEVHPVFQESNWEGLSPVVYERLQQSLRFSSMFLEDESTLEFLVGPLLGRVLKDSRSGNDYLTDPLASKSASERKKFTRKVREALLCLSHSIQFSFATGHIHCYAKTTIGKAQPQHTAKCTGLFENKLSTSIFIQKYTLAFYTNQHATASSSEKMRKDFCMAATLVHELCHAVGVMRRGHICEPYISLDHHTTEFGSAWENFMFGGIINPIDPHSDVPCIMMYKIWSDNQAAFAAGGKEHAAVPMSYIAQWFQKSTWEAIAKGGPTAIPPPRFELRLRGSKKDGEHVKHYIYTTSRDAIRDLRTFREEVKGWRQPNGKYSKGTTTLLTTKFHHVGNVEELRTFLLPVPTRTNNRPVLRSTLEAPAVEETAICKMTVAAWPYSKRPHQDGPTSAQDVHERSTKRLRRTH
jgi:hypothetical protein